MTPNVVRILHAPHGHPNVMSNFGIGAKVCTSKKWRSSTPAATMNFIHFQGSKKIKSGFQCINPSVGVPYFEIFESCLGLALNRPEFWHGKNSSPASPLYRSEVVTRTMDVTVPVWYMPVMYTLQVVFCLIAQLATKKSINKVESDSKRC